MEPRELLQALMARSGDNPHSLAAKLKRPALQSQVHRFLSGISKEPRRSTLQPVAAHYDIPIDALYDQMWASRVARQLRIDDPSITRATAEQDPTPAEIKRRAWPAEDQEPPTDYAKVFGVSTNYDDVLEHVIKQYDTGGAMGLGKLLLRDQPGHITSWHVTPEWIQKNVHNVTAPTNLAIVTGFGDSMRPLYNPGDPLLVDTGVKSVEFDGIYFFRIGDEGFIKRLQRIPGEGLVAISENKAYRDWTIKEGMDFEVFARVVKVWRGDEF